MTTLTADRLVPSSRPDWQQLADERVRVKDAYDALALECTRREQAVVTEANRQIAAIRREYAVRKAAKEARLRELLLLLYPQIDV